MQFWDVLLELHMPHYACSAFSVSPQRASLRTVNVQKIREQAHIADLIKANIEE